MKSFEQAMREAYQSGFKESGMKVDELLIDASFSRWFANFLKEETIASRIAPVSQAAVIASRYGDKATMDKVPEGMVQVVPIPQPPIKKEPPALDPIAARIARFAEGGSFEDFVKGDK